MRQEKKEKRIRCCIVLKDAIAKKLWWEKFMFTFSVVVDLPTDCILSFFFFFHAETDVLVPVLSQSTDVLVVNFAVVLKFPNNGYLTNDQ